MNAIRKIVDVKDHKINIKLPENFNANKVKVIIFEEEKEVMLERVKNICKCLLLYFLKERNRC